MTHKTITVNEIHYFIWCETRSEALRRAKEIEKQGITGVHVAGKRAKTREDYMDIQRAAIYQDKWSGGNSPWVVAW